MFRVHHFVFDSPLFARAKIFNNQKKLHQSANGLKKKKKKENMEWVTFLTLFLFNIC